MDDAQLISVAGDVRGETALAYVPRRPSTAPDVFIIADQVTHVDAWTGTALRTVIEYHARYRQKKVVLSPPVRAPVASFLEGLLNNDLPGHFCLSDDATSSGSRPRAVILPSTVVRTFSEADAIADVVPALGTAYDQRPIRYLAGAVALLAENALQHASDSPIGAVVALAHEREEHELQLIVTDMGDRVASSPDAERLLQTVSKEGATKNASLAWLVLQSERLGIDITLALIAGSGRLYWRAGTWTSAQEQHVAGFTAGVTVHL